MFLRICLIAFAALFLATNGAVAWTSVQSNQEKTGTDGSGAGVSLAFTSTVGSGHIVVGCVFYTPANAVDQISSITDDKSNTYSIVAYNGPNISVAAFWSPTRLTNTPQTVTVKTSSVTTNLWINQNEFTPTSGGALSTDGSNAGNGNSTTAATGSFTTTVNNDLVYGCTVNNGGTAAGSGFTILNGNGGNFADEFQQQPTAGAINPSFTITSATWGAAGFAIQTAASGTNKGPINLPIVGVGGD